MPRAIHRLSSAFALCIALVLVLASDARGQRVISMATLAPAGSTWMRAFDASNRELRRRTGGQVMMRWYPGGVQGDESEVIRKIRSGRLDGAAVTGIGLAQIHRPILAFQLPAMFANREEFVRAHLALRGEIEAAFERAGFVMLGFGGAGAPRMLSTRPIHTPADLRAAHPWQWRDDIILPALYDEVGATGVPLQLPEVLSALQTHRVDTVFASPLAAIALQWASHVQYISERATSGSLGGLVVSRAAFMALTPDQQAIVREVTTQFAMLLAANVRRDEETAAQTLQTRGVQVVTLTEAERMQWQAVFTRMRARLVGTIADPAWFARVQAAAHGP